MSKFGAQNIRSQGLFPLGGILHSHVSAETGMDSLIRGWDTHTYAQSPWDDCVCHRPDLASMAPRRYLKGGEWWSWRLRGHAAHLPASIFPDKTLLATHILPVL